MQARRHDLRKILLISILTTVVLGSLVFNTGQAVAPEEQLSDQQLVARFSAELPNHRLAAAKELASRGERVLPAVTKALTSDDWRVRRAATDVVIAMGETAAPVAPTLVEVLEKDRNAWVRDGAESEVPVEALAVGVCRQ